MPRFTGCSFFVPIAVIGIRGACQTRFRSYEELSIPNRKSAPQVNPQELPKSPQAPARSGTPSPVIVLFKENADQPARAAVKSASTKKGVCRRCLSLTTKCYLLYARRSYYRRIQWYRICSLPSAYSARISRLW